MKENEGFLFDFLVDFLWGFSTCARKCANCGNRRQSVEAALLGLLELGSRMRSAP
jgi:hypothetical protein